MEMPTFAHKTTIDTISNKEWYKQLQVADLPAK